MQEERIVREGGKWRESGALKSENTKETMVAEARKNKKILMNGLELVITLIILYTLIFLTC